MSLKYLLDTNIISESMRPSPHPQVVNKLRINRITNLYSYGSYSRIIIWLLAFTRIKET